MKDQNYDELRSKYEKPAQDNVESLLHFKSVNAAEVTIEKQTWLWDRYIPDQTCTLFAGRGGIGKSTLIAYLVAAISNGSTFKINGLTHIMQQGKVILLSAEDNVKRTLVPRLIANGANLANIEIIESTIDVNSKEYERFVDLDRDIHVLEAYIKNAGNVKAIFLDPVSAYIGRIKDNSAVEVRNFILRLNRIAEKYNLAIILNTHTRKKGTHGDANGSAADEIMGSSAWYNTVRQAFSITQHHEDENLILLICSKSNCGSKPEGVSYRIEPTEIENQGEIISISRVNWQAGNVSMTADEAVHKGLYEEKLEVDIAKEFILSQLMFGSKSKEEIERNAKNEDINPHTLKLARQRLSREGTPIVIEGSPTDRRKKIWYIGSCSK
jgi:putative DNA primase/helicase